MGIQADLKSDPLYFIHPQFIGRQLSIVIKGLMFCLDIFFSAIHSGVFKPRWCLQILLTIIKSQNSFERDIIPLLEFIKRIFYICHGRFWTSSSRFDCSALSYNCSLITNEHVEKRINLINFSWDNFCMLSGWFNFCNIWIKQHVNFIKRLKLM